MRLTNSAWPDLIAAALMAVLFIYSAIRIIAQAADERRGAPEFLPESRRISTRRP